MNRGFLLALARRSVSRWTRRRISPPPMWWFRLLLGRERLVHLWRGWAARHQGQGIGRYQGAVRRG